MRMWVVKHKNYVMAPLNLTFALVEDVNAQESIVKAVHLFTRKRHAKEYADRMNKPINHMVVVPVEVTTL